MRGVEVSPILTLVVPCYNSADYMARCVDSLLAPAATDVEIIIVNDGSSDRTGAIADEYAAAYPGVVRVIHKENGGHGSTINAGLARAAGAYFKVVDSDDWLNVEAYREVLALLRAMVRRGEDLDLLITNFVYEKQGKRVKRVVDYRHALPRGRVFGWNQVRSFRTWQYMLMHAMVYRTELLRDCGLSVPEHSFYVDNYFAFVPLPQVKRLSYLDVDLYRYFIGRQDQSVNEEVMIRRIDQQLRINLLMIESLSQALRAGELSTALQRYMIRYANLVSVVSSALLVRDGSPESLAKKSDLWHQIEEINPELYARMRKEPIGRIVSREGRCSRAAIRFGYVAARCLVGFN